MYAPGSAGKFLVPCWMHQAAHHRSAVGAAKRSPARQGWEDGKQNSKHRRCDTMFAIILAVMRILPAGLAT